jgi:phosphoribosylamine---glycine ligase
MRVLVVGGGGREHALASRIARSPLAEAVFCAPGNAGTAAVAKNLAVDAEDIPGILRAVVNHAIDFVVVGPEAPLVAGLVDALASAGVAAFGPRAAGAQLEGSKSFSKRFMQAHGIPTAAFETFTVADQASEFVKRSGKPWVVKADGLAAGKGVVVASDVAETLDAIDRTMRAREFGDAGAKVVLEEILRGQEVSYHVVLDGTRYVPLAAAQDHKRLLAGDRGPNTGGMGAYSPPPIVTREVEEKILSRVVEPTVRGLREEKIDFRGTLFIGLMIDGGEPRVLEYNTRFGDPECEVLMARFGGDVLPLLVAAARGDLSSIELRWDAPFAMGVVLAAPGYPGSVKKGLPIAGLERAARVAGVEVLHAGTKSGEGGGVVTSGGRVLCVTGSGVELDAVAASVYEAVRCIEFEGAQYRDDIGHHARKSP